MPQKVNLLTVVPVHRSAALKPIAPEDLSGLSHEDLVSFIKWRILALSKMNCGESKKTWDAIWETWQDQSDNPTALFGITRGAAYLITKEIMDWVFHVKRDDLERAGSMIGYQVLHAAKYASNDKYTQAMIIFVEWREGFVSSLRIMAAALEYFRICMLEDENV